MLPRTSDFGTALVFLTLILSGVHSADVVPPFQLALGDSPATSSSFTTHLISIKITNRIYNDTLKDPNSADYKRLLKDVRLLLNSALEEGTQYDGRITDMTFSNGSVIANTTIQFGTTEIDPVKVKYFINKAQSSTLDLQKDSTKVIPFSPPPELRQKKDVRSPDNQPAIPTTTPFEVDTVTASTRMGFTSAPNSTQNHTTTASVHALSSTEAYGTNISQTTTPHPAPLNSTSIPAGYSSHPSSTSTGIPDHSSHDTSSANITSTTTASTGPPVTSTIPHVSSISNETTMSLNYTSHSPHTTVTDLGHNTSPSYDKNNETVSTVSTTTAGKMETSTLLNQTSRPSDQPTRPTALSTAPKATGVSTMSHNSSSLTSLATSRSHNTAPTAQQEPTSNPIATQPSGAINSPEEGVPGWGIALLVLAALILLMLFIFLFYLMYFCCCRRASNPTPYMPFNPDIPMYSTQSTIDLPNGKAYEDRPTNNRSGMYVVNPGTPK
ncbi:hypothetical protein ACEWY4_020085 [Coilia grayii]|uniref:Mucin-1 n=1 Tax=Coilia grayii TaxID=363190 RepID=A0ABD1JBX4_9TELE